MEDMEIQASMIIENGFKLYYLLRKYLDQNQIIIVSNKDRDGGLDENNQLKSSDHDKSKQINFRYTDKNHELLIY